MMNRIVFLLLSIFLIGCNSGSNEDSDSYESGSSESSPEEYGYKDGTYCAEVQYYYSNTGTHSTYTLEVEIEDNELTVIHWPNGGWLDDSHFSPPDISDGTASFRSDQGVDYDVTIIGEGGDCYVDQNAKSESELVQEAEEEEYRIQQQEEEQERIQREEEEQERMQREREGEE